VFQSIKEEFVNVEVYFDNLNYYLYKERASMTVSTTLTYSHNLLF